MNFAFKLKKTPLTWDPGSGRDAVRFQHTPISRETILDFSRKCIVELEPTIFWKQHTVCPKSMKTFDFKP